MEIKLKPNERNNTQKLHSFNESQTGNDKENVANTGKIYYNFEVKELMDKR